MKILEVKNILFKRDYPDLDIVSSSLDELGIGEAIDVLNWAEFDYKPEARFNIACGKKEIFLKYYIREEFVKAEMKDSGQPVWEDSCVEFFLSLSGDGIYYNFEFNAIGTCLLGTGTSRTGRTRADNSITSLIRRKGSMGETPFKERHGDNSWTLTIAFPFSVFFHHKPQNMKGKSIMANFYKCGDGLSRPHYLSWNPIETDRPDFHRPEFFGMLKFI